MTASRATVPRRPAALRLAPLALAAVVGLPLDGARAVPAAAAARPGAEWPLRAAVTTIHLDEGALARLGLRLARVTARAAAPPAHPLSFAPAGAPAFRSEGRAAALRAQVADDTLQGFAGGPLRHRGGFVLEGPRATLDFAGFALRAGRRRFSLEVLDAAGEPLLVAVQPWFDLDPSTGALRYINADLRLTRAFARRLGERRLAGVTVGTLELRGTLDVGPMPRRHAAVAGSSPPPCDDLETGEVDVALIDMDAVGHVDSAPDGRLVLAPSVTLKNVGTANVPWYIKYTGPFPPYQNDQHPFLVWQMVRISGGAVEPLGRNDMKHAFATANWNCDPGACNVPNGHVLGLGCEDPYNVGSNTWPSALAPRSEVSAFTGVWAHCNEPAPGTPSHFDADGNCNPERLLHGDTPDVHGMKVSPTALLVPGARYFLEAFYVVRDDVAILNSMGRREVLPTPGSTWTFAFAGPFRQGPAIDEWVGRGVATPGADNRLIDTGTGRLQVAVRVTELDGGRRTFAFAVQNHDFDRKVESFRVPFDTAGVSRIAFADGDADGGNDWTPALDAAGITWTAPADNDLDWGTLFAFRFESAQPFTELVTALAAHEAGSPGAPDLLEARLCNHPSPCFADGFESGGTGAWSARQP